MKCPYCKSKLTKENEIMVCNKDLDSHYYTDHTNNGINALFQGQKLILPNYTIDIIDAKINLGTNITSITWSGGNQYLLYELDLNGINEKKIKTMLMLS